MKKIIVVVNQKGGVGKTTTVLNLASSLAIQQRKKVLVVDIDPQGNATTGAGIDKNNLEYSIYDVLLGSTNIRDAITYSKSSKFDLVPSNRDLAGAEIELVGEEEREYKLRNAIKAIEHKYDIILIDCPPSLSLLTVNALSCADCLLVPIQCEYYALEGLTDLLNTIKLMKTKLNTNLSLLGILRTMYDRRNNLAQQVSEQLVEHFDEKVFYASIPRTVRLAEAPSFGMSAVALDVGAIGSEAYCKLAREVVKRLREINE